MWWIGADNNWNAVCTAGVVGSALAVLRSPQERALYVAAAEQSMRYFLSGFTDDGYCSEGLGYWNYGFGHYLMLAETVFQATGGKLDWFQGDKVRLIAEYGQRIEIINGHCPAFADCRVGEHPSVEIMGFVSRRYGFGWQSWEEAAFGPSVGPLGSLSAQGVSRFPNLALRQAPAKLPESGASPAGRPLRDWFSTAGILICRPMAGHDDALGVALKGGNNGGPHSHNDVGSFVVAFGKSTPLLDPGSEVYTARTFSSHRYDSKVINSFGHSVPRVAGALQRSGRSAEGKVLSTAFSDQSDTLVLDIRSAYAVKGLKKLIRTFVYSRQGRGSLTVTDEVEFDSPQTFGTALITCGPWKSLDDARLLVGDAPDCVEVQIQAPGASPRLKAEEIHENVHLKRLPVRLGIDLAEPVLRGKISLTIRPAAATPAR